MEATPRRGTPSSTSTGSTSFTLITAWRAAGVYFKMPSYWLGDVQAESQGGSANIVGVVWGAGQASGLEEFTDQIIEEARKNSDVTGATRAST